MVSFAVDENLSNFEKMDVLDRKILRSLSSKDRLTYKKISKLVKASNEVVKYRIKKLMKKNILLKILPIINKNKVGYRSNMLMLKLNKFSEIHEKRLVNSIVNNPYVENLCIFASKWDFYVVFCCKDIIQFNNFILEIKKKCKDSLKEKKITSNLIEYFLPFENSFEGEREFFEIDVCENQIEIDKIDVKILFELSMDGSENLINLSKKIKLTPEAISYRLKKLKKNKIILGYHPIINYTVFGYQLFSVTLNTREISVDHEKKLLYFLRNIPNSIYVLKATGQWDFEVDFWTRNIVEFRKILNSIRENFSEIIIDFEPNVIFSSRKYTLFPKGILEDYK